MITHTANDVRGTPVLEGAYVHALLPWQQLQSCCAHLCIHHVKGILCIYEGGIAAQLLHFCYSVHGQRGLAAALWAINLHRKVRHMGRLTSLHTVGMGGLVRRLLLLALLLVVVSHGGAAAAG
jgi:hypothetical protein